MDRLNTPSLVVKVKSSIDRFWRLLHRRWGTELTDALSKSQNQRVGDFHRVSRKKIDRRWWNWYSFGHRFCVKLLLPHVTSRSCKKDFVSRTAGVIPARLLSGRRRGS